MTRHWPSPTPRPSDAPSRAPAVESVTRIVVRLAVPRLVGVALDLRELLMNLVLEPLRARRVAAVGALRPSVGVLHGTRCGRRLSVVRRSAVADAVGGVLVLQRGVEIDRGSRGDGLTGPLVVGVVVNRHRLTRAVGDRGGLILQTLPLTITEPLKS